MADWGKILGGVLQATTALARATIMDWDSTSRRLWISKGVISVALARRNKSVGLLGVLVEVSIVGDTAIRVDLTTKPLGVRGTYLLTQGMLVLDGGAFVASLRIAEASGPLSILVKGLPLVFDAMFGLGVTRYNVEIEGDVIHAMGPIPDGSWFIQLLRAHVQRIDGARIPFYPCDSGIVVELAEFVPQGVLLDVGQSIRALGAISAQGGA
jgi:hypothetical protein